MPPASPDAAALDPPPPQPFNTAMIVDILFVVGAYLFGSISAAILTCRLLGLPDPRQQGSGNPGATNVLRLGGRMPAAMTLTGDFLKGTLPVSLAMALDMAPITVAGVGLAAFLGHLFPVFFGFRGGKGIATGLGVLLAWSWQALLVTGGVWLLMAAMFRYSSLAGMTSFLLAAVWLWVFGAPTAVVVAMLLITAATLWRHRSNIRNLINGTENKIGRKKVG
ncbi:MAG: glycerol-3-phosphate 1-O-acyltransferase PlsY [Aquisalimonadaceae bacterium]